MKKLIAISLFSLCTLPLSAMADSTAELDAFGSYINTSTDAAPPKFEPSGGGGGLRARLNIPFAGFFVGAEGQKNSLSDGGTDLDLTDNRVGLGTQFDLGPASLFGKVEYVHLLGTSAGVDDNDDGFGVHVGADIGIGIVGVHGSVGAIKLGQGKGPEVLVGVHGSLIPLVGLFAEYRYTSLRDAFGSTDTVTINDFRVGVRISL